MMAQQWQQQWEQDLFAQSLLNAAPQSQANQTESAVAEATQESDIQQLMQKFPHVDESIIYSTYFEQANMDLKMATQLISAQFP